MRNILNYSTDGITFFQKLTSRKNVKNALSDLNYTDTERANAEKFSYIQSFDNFVNELKFGFTDEEITEIIKKIETEGEN